MKHFLFPSLIRVGKIVLASILFMFFCMHTDAQNTESITFSKNNLYVDVGGHFGAQVSLNYECQFYSGKKVTWYGRGGLGAAGIIMATGGLGGLGAVTMVTGKGNRHFELNGGAFVGYDTDLNQMFLFPLLDFGYRYQKPEGGFIFKSKLGILGIGIGIGYAF
jgi:hypothetical protein